ncbi:MAG TPA: LptE family protein [Nitrospiria bacterium]|nr:LptE family protein [Nitrospiria bacterium]
MRQVNRQKLEVRSQKRATIIILFSLLTSYLLLPTFLSGCGYRQVEPGLPLPLDAKTIAIPTFRNQTFESALESTLTTYVKEEFITSNRFGVTNNPDEADLVLKGIIQSFGLTPLSIDQTTGRVLEYRVKIVLDITLEDPKSQKVLWRESSLETTAEFFAGADPSATRVAQNRAVAEAGKHLAEELVSRVLEGESR